ncbi:vWA domain-containing protein [Hominiventricola filiformis]|uniref:VWA-like domain-containing protein n=1 Tax=Hominiventricola filiformis TaxID=2885352 RepID=A0AAE3AC35_9FIRM|nr:VWA-like domain-containing protein [Hominiventricola filiformis]MCC2127181.1 VWA-like domain-containing protein [Hominiventricola filiformis]
MAYEIEAGFENICRKILESSRNALYINMRYLDVALSSLAWEITTDIPRIGTDGLKIAYEPHYLADLYRENPMLVNRVYLHMVFHCIFRHLFRPCPEDRELWNLSCDMAVEALIDGMHHRSIRMGVHPFRRAVYDELRKTLKVLTAEGIYRELKKADYRPEQRARMVQEFCIDDHTYWPAPPEEEGPKPPSPLMAKLKKHWKDVSDRMQTELSIGREAGTEDGDLSDELAVENRERYDYRTFLRKFAVLKEEMQIDPDSFDYVFYSYGLRMYGNMPLIEPQEWKETHKIEEFVIVIDTSMSCSGDLVRKFLEETYHILAETESFFRKVHIRILQCDDAVRADQLITTGEELKQYMDHLQLYGDGGTDFRPAFTYVQQLIDQGEFKNLKGLLYFTDGKGTFPRKRPPYDAAFILFREDYKEVSVPPWAIRLMLDEEDL